MTNKPARSQQAVSARFPLFGLSNKVGRDSGVCIVQLHML